MQMRYWFSVIVTLPYITCAGVHAQGDGREGYQPAQPGYYQPGNAPAQNFPGGNPQGYNPQGVPANYQQFPATYAPQPSGQAKPAPANPQMQARVHQWFLKYDDIRRRAQMNPIEKQQADSLLGRGLSIIMPGPEKLAAKEILAKLVTRYQTATQSLMGLPSVPETLNLQKGYYQYFDTAGKLFSDYMRVQDNLMATDASGQPIMGQLLQRKQALEVLERQVKEYDLQVRNQFGVAPYQY